MKHKKNKTLILTLDLLLEPRADDKPNKDACNDGKADGNEHHSPPVQFIKA